MHINLLKKVVETTIGKQAVELIELLLKKKNVNEFIIAKKIKLTINQTRNLLYKLSEKGLISSTRKKDKKKGWYTYFWTLELGDSLSFLRKILEKEIEQLKNLIKSRENKRFYICKTCEIELSEENALLNDFLCRECGELLELNVDRKMIEDSHKKINKLESQLKFINEELSKMSENKTKEAIKKAGKEKRKKAKLREKARKKEKRKEERAEKAENLKRESRKAKKKGENGKKAKKEKKGKKAKPKKRKKRR